MKMIFDNTRYVYADGSPLESGSYKQHTSTRFINYEKGINNFLGKELPHLYDQIYECCGCSACEAVCPRQAIQMQRDEEGFFYPVIDLEKCIRCLQCKRVCAFKEKKREKSSDIYNRK